MLRSLSDSPALSHHPELYFSDGDIVVRCRNRDRTDSFTYFRIHRAILEKSKLLRNVLSIPHPDDDQQFYDNVPMVDSIDDPRDMAVVLKFAYDPCHSPVHENDVGNAYSPFGVLQMTDKFMLDELKAIILDHIRRDWPTTLEAWDKRERVVYERWQAAPRKSMDLYAPEPAAVIRVARQFDRSILPTVFYHLSRTSVDMSYSNQSDEVLKGLQRVDCSPRSARTELLTGEDRFKALAGRERILSWIEKRVAKSDIEEKWGLQCPLNDPNDTRKPRACYNNVVSRLLTIQANIVTNWDPLKMFDNNFDDSGNGNDCECLCKQCRRTWGHWTSELRLELFDQLPNFFLDL